MPPKKRRANVQEYTLDDFTPRLETVYEYTEYGSSRRVQNSLVSLPKQSISTPIEVEPQRLPSPLLLDSDYNTPDQSYVLLADGDIELAEMENCELEIAGMAITSDTNIPSEDEGSNKRRRTQSTHPIEFWTPHIDLYVNELLRLEGRGYASSQTHCYQKGCKELVTNGYRCSDCECVMLLCNQCICIAHKHLPFHRIKASLDPHRWSGEYFVDVTLKSLGLRIQLGHGGKPCGLPVVTFNNDFIVIAGNGIHEVALSYCGCTQAIPKVSQLLQHRLFPSTVGDPKTAATFSVLDQFQLLSFASKVSGFEFYRTLARMTNNTGTKQPMDRYPVFMRIVREWRHVRLLKRKGRGHAASGVKGTQEGECAVLCPACPYPGINLPADWKDQPQGRQWLYSLFIGIDANFRLKRLNVSSSERDPGLNRGYAYMVEEQKFKSYLHEFDNRVSDEKSGCNNHDAIKSANIRGGKGAAASGLGTAECSRHDMKRPLGVGDLQKGERYVNMDYFILSSLHNTQIERIVFSYDIACQWSRNLLKRCSMYPLNSLSPGNNIEVVYAVPKFHLPAHIAPCRANYSFNFLPGVGRTDGESPERGWAAANGIANSTREMGPGSRSDTLDDHFTDYNWRKITSLADTFLRKAKEAILERQEHVESFIEFDAALPAPDTLKWTRMCQAWEADPKQINPFAITRKAVTDRDVRLRLAEEDAVRLATGQAPVLHEEVTPSLLIWQGLEIEDLQFRLQKDISRLGQHATSLQKTKLIERSNAIQRKIEAWAAIQHLYTPGVAVLRARHEGTSEKPVAAHMSKLFLPSECLGRTFCDAVLMRIEWDFRMSRTEEILNDLRGYLLLRSHMWKSKHRHSVGQKMNTRSHQLLSDVEAKIQNTVSTYRTNYRAIEILSKPLLETEWKDSLRPLEDSDVVGLTSMDISGSEGRKRLSWIWKAQGTGANADECTQEALRIEYCKTRARAHRWQEECVLLAEEMRRVIAFFDWEKRSWNEKASDLKEMFSDGMYDSLIEGKIAYACRQANIREEMSNHCILNWKGLHESMPLIQIFEPLLSIGPMTSFRHNTC
ncbi:hypothetical protein BJ912DRAFT_1021968 [Pholiota molesta]|nr:hypothetical protein BJ912DRAFT_1021968 [Pholiota molesta]